jgi:hypothetical protein
MHFRDIEPHIVSAAHILFGADKDRIGTDQNYKFVCFLIRLVSAPDPLLSAQEKHMTGGVANSRA